MGSDLCDARSYRCGQYFNPRSPDGERLRYEDIMTVADFNFNPRSPDGERLRHGVTLGSPADFNPRSPDGERLMAR